MALSKEDRGDIKQVFGNKFATNISSITKDKTSQEWIDSKGVKKHHKGGMIGFMKGLQNTKTFGAKKKTSRDKIKAKLAKQSGNVPF